MYNPDWLTNFSGTADELDKILADHIQSVILDVNDYANMKVPIWDVVNEAVTDSWTGGPLKEAKPWYPLLPDYVDRAFNYAHLADPDALLFYNDYNVVTSSHKEDYIVEMIQGMQSRGVPIHGMGMQMHVSVDNPPTREHIAAVIKRFGDLGLQVHVTELDVKCDACWGTDGAAPLAAEAKVYEDALSACVLDNPGVCTAFLTWGLTDKHTWLGSDKHPLPFDENYAKKPAYDSMLYVL